MALLNVAGTGLGGTASAAAASVPANASVPTTAAATAGNSPPSGSGPPIAIEYKGTYDATEVDELTNQGAKQTVVAHVQWDPVWSGSLKTLLYNYRSRLFSIKVLTGKVKYSEPGQNCTATFSPGARHPTPGVKNPPLPFSAYIDSADTSKVVIGVTAPITLAEIHSDQPSCVGDSAASIGAPDTRHLLIPVATFDLSPPRGKSEVLPFSGTWSASDVVGNYTSTLDSSLSFGTSICAGTGAGVLGIRICYVALGDSYSAGQLSPFVAGGEACARSTYAYPYVYDVNVDFLACSGATIASITDDQVPHITKFARLVTVTAGGNDTSIYYDLLICVFRSVVLADCKNRFPPPDFSSLQQPLVNLYKAVHERAPNGSP